MRIATEFGTIEEKETGDFWVWETPSDFRFPGVDVLDEIDDSLVRLHSVFEKRLLQDSQRSAIKIGSVPEWVFQAGIDPESKLSSQDLSKEIQNSQSEIINRVMLVADIVTIISSIQDRIIEVRQLFGRFYFDLAELNLDEFGSDFHGVRVVHGLKTIQIYSDLENFFVKLYALFDLISKLAFEATSTYEEPSDWPKLRSKNVLWGDGKGVWLDSIEGTIFEKAPEISQIVSLRNEIIHNGSFANQNKVYVVYSNGKIVAKFVLLMDMSEHGIETCKNRKRFYSRETHVNHELPVIFHSVASRILVTLKKIETTANSGTQPQVGDQ